MAINLRKSGDNSRSDLTKPGDRPDQLEPPPAEINVEPDIIAAALATQGKPQVMEQVTRLDDIFRHFDAGRDTYPGKK